MQIEYLWKIHVWPLENEIVSIPVIYLHSLCSTSIIVFLEHLVISEMCLSSDLHPDSDSEWSSDAWIERVIIAGYPRQPKGAEISAAGKFYKKTKPLFTSGGTLLQEKNLQQIYME